MKFIDERGSNGTTVAWYSWDGSRRYRRDIVDASDGRDGRTLFSRSREWQRAVNRWYTSERERTLRRAKANRTRTEYIRALHRLLWPSVLCGRRTVPFRSLSAAFLLPFLLRDSYPVGNDCTFLEFRQGARIIRIVIVIFAVWSILYFQPEHKNSSQGPGLGCRIVIDNEIIYLPFGTDDKICNTVIDAGFIKSIQFITFIKRY